MTILIIIFAITLLFMFFAGCYNSICDCLQSSALFNASIFKLKKNQQFWDFSISWVNKYKNGDPAQGEKFLGSTTFLVWATDGWHLFKALWLVTVCIIISLIIVSIPLAVTAFIDVDFSVFEWYWYSTSFCLLIVLYTSVWGIGFEVTKKLIKA